MKDLIYGAKFGIGFIIGQQVARFCFLGILRVLMGKEDFDKCIDEHKTK